MHSTADAGKTSHAKFHCNRPITVQGIQDYASLIIWGHIINIICNV